MNGRIKGGYFIFGLFIFLIASLILIAVKPISGQPTSVMTTCDPKNLTGKWTANDGATYFIRQIGNEIWWFGARSLQEGTPFSNVFHGSIGNYGGWWPGTAFTGYWKDVPLGKSGESGKLTIIVDPSGQKLTKHPDRYYNTDKNFGGSEWRKNCKPLG
jgi:hypothetical protein